MRTSVLAITVAAASILSFGTGCSKSTEDDTAAEPSALDKTVEDVTGVTTIRQGERTKDRIKAIQAERDQQYNDAMGE